MKSSRSTQNFKEALKEAQRGSVDHQYSVALMYERGEGTKTNLFKCIRWYRIAARNGHASACVKLGDYYKLRNDLAIAVYWYHLAYTKGYSGINHAYCRTSSATFNS